MMIPLQQHLSAALTPTHRQYPLVIHNPYMLKKATGELTREIKRGVSSRRGN